MIQFGDVYKGKTVLVTGHTGFKGSWLCFWLNVLGAKVVGYSIDIPTSPNHHQLLNTPMVSVIGDILDQKKLQKTFGKYRPDIVFHLAAQALVRDSYEDPVGTYMTNVIGTLQVFEAARKTTSVKAIINVTTDKCYENREQTKPYKESDPMGGFDPYSSSKGCSELVSSSYRRSFFNESEYGKTHQTLLATARSGNVIGGGDWAEHRLIPDIVKATAKQTSVELRNPKSTRPWQHVLETISGYLLLGQHLLQKDKDAASAWNFGPSAEQTKEVKEVATEAIKYWKDIKLKFAKKGSSLHEAQLLALDSSKALKKLKWKNLWSFSEGVEYTIEWYKWFYEKKKTLTEQHLEAYIKKAQEKKAVWLVK